MDATGRPEAIISEDDNGIRRVANARAIAAIPTTANRMEYRGITNLSPQPLAKSSLSAYVDETWRRLSKAHNGGRVGDEGLDIPAGALKY